MDFLLEEGDGNVFDAENTAPISEDEIEPEAEPLEPENEENKTEEDSIPVKRKKLNIKLLVSLSVGIVLCMSLLAGGYYLNRQQKQKEDAELRFWYLCIERNTPQAYSNYLQIYPRGKFKGEAQNKITKLREVESTAWEQLKKSSNLNDYYAFLSVYPLTPFKAEARKIMDSLSWKVAVKENTAEAYLAYVQNADLNNISGFYREIAQSKYNYLSKIKSVEGDEFGEVLETLGMLFKTLSTHQFKKLTDLLNTPSVNNFYGARNRSSAMIVKSIEADMVRNNIKTLVYEPQYDSIKVSKDDKGIFIVSLPVNKKISYKSKKNKENILERLHIELTPEKKVRYFHTNKDDSI